MASLTRLSKATYETHEDVTIDTSDHRDHTFCGVMFPVRTKKQLPIDKVIINSLSVRGSLGPITIWVTGSDKNDQEGEKKRYEQVQFNGQTWHKIYASTHLSSFNRFKKLELSTPFILKPGEFCTFYIHSADNSDRAIVYDNARGRDVIFEDDVLRIDVGRAHLSTTPFGNTNIWGHGGAWRNNRAFVGQVNYGIIYKLWNPEIHTDFGNAFDQMVLTLLLCQRRFESPLSLLPDDCIYFILNMCGYNWAAPYRKSNNRLFLESKCKSTKGLPSSNENQRRGTLWDSTLRKIFSPILRRKAS